MPTLEETLRRPINRQNWSRWQLTIVNFILKRLFDLSDGVAGPLQIIRVTSVDMPRPDFAGLIIWIGGFDEPTEMAEQDLHLAEVP